MPLLETKGAASSQGFGGAGAGASGPVTYIEDVFSTWLYTGNSSTQTITNGVDLAGEGGMVWLKTRSNVQSHVIADTERGVNKVLFTESTSSQVSTTSVTSFNSNGFSLGNYSVANYSTFTYASWTFRKQPKFFDIVTYTGNGANRTISHNLGSVPGCIIVKRTDAVADWQVYHRSLANTEYLVLNSANAQAIDTTRWNSTTPTSTVFSLGTHSTVNANGGTYVAYLFAHNAGGFGLSGTDNVISCGVVNVTGADTPSNLGYEPQLLIFKKLGGGTDWEIYDSMRGLDNTNQTWLRPSTTDSEAFISGTAYTKPTSTGFTYSASFGGSGNYIYIAIRRPMKVPTSGTSVFAPLAYVGDQSTARRDLDVGFVVDAGLFLNRTRTTYSTSAFTDRLRGAKSLTTSSASAESDLSGYLWFDDQNGIDVGQIGDLNPVVAGVGQTMVLECLKRAPGFFDVVCYTGNSVNPRAITHNLTVAPELLIVKNRSLGTLWMVGTTFTASNCKELQLNSTSQAFTYAYTNQFKAQPTSTTFTVGSTTILNDSGSNYVAYLFATCPGVSKVGSYTGNGSSQTINCGFTGGARFVLIKRTDSTGDWYVWDTARGIVAGNDPHLSLNSTAAEVTTNDSIDTDSTGFIVNQLAATNINISSATYIFLAIA